MEQSVIEGGVLSDAEILHEIQARRISIQPATWPGPGVKTLCWLAVSLKSFFLNVQGEVTAEPYSSIGNTPQAAVTRLVRRLREIEAAN